jgi:HlyD family secretion protein
VFVIAQGRAMLRPVVIGRRDRTHAEVLEGLEAGARVVIHPPDTLADGGRVTFTD